MARFLFPVGIRDRPTSFRSPWQNGYAERLIGSIRRDCIDHVVVFGERHLRHVPLSYKQYYNATRTHLSLNKNAPFPRGVEWGREYRLPPDPGRTAPSIWPDVIYVRHSQRRQRSVPQAVAPGRRRRTEKPVARSN